MTDCFAVPGLAGPPKMKLGEGSKKNISYAMQVMAVVMWWLPCYVLHICAITGG
jgi:hypothetical protein